MMEVQESFRQLDTKKFNMQAESSTKESYIDCWFRNEICLYLTNLHSTLSIILLGDYRKQNVTPEKDQGMPWD